MGGVPTNDGVLGPSMPIVPAQILCILTETVCIGAGELKYGFLDLLLRQKCPTYDISFLFSPKDVNNWALKGPIGP